MGPSVLPGQSVESVFNLSNSTDGQPGKSVPFRWVHTAFGIFSREGTWLK